MASSRNQCEGCPEITISSTKEVLQQEMEASESTKRRAELETELAESKQAQAELREELQQVQKELYSQSRSASSDTTHLVARSDKLKAAENDLDRKIKCLMKSLAEESERRSTAQQRANEVVWRRKGLESELKPIALDAASITYRGRTGKYKTAVMPQT